MEITINPLRTRKNDIVSQARQYPTLLCASIELFTDTCIKCKIKYTNTKYYVDTNIYMNLYGSYSQLWTDLYEIRQTSEQTHNNPTTYGGVRYKNCKKIIIKHYINFYLALTETMG